MAPPEGLEPATYRVETCCSIQLSYGGTESILMADVPVIGNWFYSKLANRTILSQTFDLVLIER